LGAFQVHLVSTGISWAALNQIVCALRFFHGVTLGEALIPERIAYAREPRKLPVALGADEVVQFLEAVSSLKSRAALTTPMRPRIKPLDDDVAERVVALTLTDPPTLPSKRRTGPAP
jgi:integrase